MLHDLISNKNIIFLKKATKIKCQRAVLLPDGVPGLDDVVAAILRRGLLECKVLFFALLLFETYFTKITLIVSLTKWIFGFEAWTER